MRGKYVPPSTSWGPVQSENPGGLSVLASAKQKAVGVGPKIGFPGFDAVAQFAVESVDFMRRLP